MTHFLNVSVLLESTGHSFSGEKTFPQVLAVLREIGVERYSVDLSRLEKLSYSSCGDSVAIPLPLEGAPEIAADWSEEKFIAALRANQQGKSDYSAFLKRIMEAGCVCYWVFIDGRYAVYYGRKGETHTEKFPAGF